MASYAAVLGLCTMGAGIGAFVIMRREQAFYREKIVHLPHCYQPNDPKRLIADITPTRAECGPPREGFVFC